MSKFLDKLKEISTKANNLAEKGLVKSTAPDQEKPQGEIYLQQQDSVAKGLTEKEVPTQVVEPAEGSAAEVESEVKEGEAEKAGEISEPVDKKRSWNLPEKLKPLEPVLLVVREKLREKPLHRRPLFWVGLAGLALGSGATAGVVYLQSIEKDLPPTGEVFTFERDGTLTIKAQDGTILQQVGNATREKYTIEQIPKQLREAFIAIEDRRFYDHKGVDVQGVIRAGVSNLLARDVVQGGSTITQQLARIVFLDQDPTAKRKIREALLAQKIEREMKKDQILERYLNLVYLGSGAYGVADAAWVYFGKKLNELTLPEMATIAGLPPAPTDYSPLVNPKVAEKRRNIVLQEMQDMGFITAAEAQSARDTALKLDPKLPKRLQILAPYFTSYIQKELPKYVSAEALERGGLTVETTLNLEWQKTAEKVVKDIVENEGAAEGFEQAAIVAIDPRNGEVKALVGGTGFGDSQFNRATQAMRQPGSTFKGFVYTAAIAAGFSPYDGFQDAPMTIDGYQPQNYGKTYRHGWVALTDALTSSINVVAVRVLADVGFEPTIKLAKDMGIKTELKPYYALALGAIEVNLLELTSGYGTLAAQGTHVETHGIRKVTDSKGKVLFDGSFDKKQVVDKTSAAIMTWMMQQVVNSGTGRPAALDRPVAGKTGTSEQARDLWFIGFIPQLVTGVWLGNDDSYPTWGSSGTAALTWHEFMSKVTKDMPVEKFAELPELEGRKGSIKAKPVNASISYGAPPPVPADGAGGGAAAGGAGYSDQGYSNQGYSDQGYSNQGYSDQGGGYSDQGGGYSGQQ
ncbi:transglycosylase domain-containing protein [Ancylothrix sp. D3o]|uniref:transglycosylase domain-containing protein n=1 Tax=Ancylothrix sp. D3o TaxID=2953691 RepID=UPI0035C8F65A